MLGLDKQAARAAWTVLFIVAAVGVAYLARKTLLIFAVALLFAYMLAPLVDLAERFTPARVPRTASLALVYVVLILVLAVVGSALGGKLSDEGAQLTARWPELVQRTNEWTQQALPGWMEPVRIRLADYMRSLLGSGVEQLVPYLKEASGRVFSIVSNALFVILIPILAFFFLKDGRELRETLVSHVANESQARVVDGILSDLHLLLGQYIRALVLLALATFVFYMVAFAIMGVPYGVLLAGIAAPLEFIPVVGPLSASAIVVLVAAVSGYSHVFWIVVFLAVYRLFQDYVLNPYLMSAGVAVHPVLVLFGVLAGEQVAGVPGMFFSVPFMAMLRVIYVRMQRSRLLPRERQIPMLDREQ
jgi:predicted PurR-regulated permease PerM